MAQAGRDLADLATRRPVADGGWLACLPEALIARWAAQRGLTLRQAMIACLADGLWPERFRAAWGVLDAAGQIRLLESRVAVIGCGGLGGWCALQLARWGVGQLVLCDDDVFDESNQNRQALAEPATLGQAKAMVAAAAVARLNPAVEARALVLRADEASLPAILDGCQAAVDCLDNHASRYALERAAAVAGLPYVHGAVAGLEGMLMVTPPGGPGLAALYGPRPAAKEESAEAVMGVPTGTPAVVASLQAMEVVKLLLGWPGLAAGRVLHLDLAGPSLELLQTA